MKNRIRIALLACALLTLPGCLTTIVGTSDAFTPVDSEKTCLGISDTDQRKITLVACVIADTILFPTYIVLLPIMTAI